MPSNFFGNVYWPSGCVYNVQAEAGVRCGGGADIEHHDAQTARAVWVQRHDERAVIDYAEDARTRCSGSD